MVYTVGVDDLSLVGPSAAVAASMLWVLTSLFFTAGGKRIGVTSLNIIRIVIAIVLLAGTQLLLNGTLRPDIQHASQWLTLALSGIIGLSLCDQALFTAFVDIGPRRALLCMTTSPIFALFFGLMFLGEQVTWVAGLAIAVTLGGVVWVISERAGPGPRDEPGPRGGRFRRGVLLAMIGAVSQAAGSMFSKTGMGVGWLPQDQQLSAQSATLVRMVFGLFGMAPIVLVLTVMARRGDRPEPLQKRWASGLGFTAAGAVVGPYLGVWLSLVAFKFSPLAVAQTLCSLSPVLILPFSKYVLKEQITARAVVGAFVALLGASALTFAQPIQVWIRSLF